MENLQFTYVIAHFYGEIFLTACKANLYLSQ